MEGCSGGGLAPGPAVGEEVGVIGGWAISASTDSP